MSQLRSLLAIVQARRRAIEAEAPPRDFLIADFDRNGGKQQIDAMIASGEAKPNDNFMVVRWKTDAEAADDLASDSGTSRK